MIEMARQMHKKRSTLSAAAIVTATVLILFIVFPWPSFSEAISEISENTEEKAVLQAARNFLDAEKNRDYPAVYNSFSPSSAYKQTHSYEEYLKEARESSDRLVDYTIIGISYIQENEDLEAWPSVEKIAQVEVDIVFLHKPTAQRSEINIGFIFLKEGGKWYKS